MGWVDGHIHIERGEYSLEWIQQFVDKAVERQVDDVTFDHKPEHWIGMDVDKIYRTYFEGNWL